MKTLNINENDVAKLVQQVLQEMTSGAPASAPKAQAAPIFIRAKEHDNKSPYME